MLVILLRKIVGDTVWPNQCRWGECFAICLQGGSFTGKEGGALAPNHLPISPFCCQMLAAQRTGWEGDQSRKQFFKMWAAKAFCFGKRFKRNLRFC